MGAQSGEGKTSGLWSGGLGDTKVLADARIDDRWRQMKEARKDHKLKEGGVLNLPIKSSLYDKTLHFLSYFACFATCLPFSTFYHKENEYCKYYAMRYTTTRKAR